MELGANELLDADLTLDDLKKYIRKYFPDYTIIKIEEVESADRQSYKYLYENATNELRLMNEEVFSQQSRIEGYERENSELLDQIDSLKKVNDKFLNTTSDIMAFIKDITEKEIVVSNTCAVNKDGQMIITDSEQRKTGDDNSMSLLPGIYDFKRPSWFTQLNVEFTKANVIRKNADRTSSELLHKVLFWERLKKRISSKQISEETISDEIDNVRLEKIKKLLLSDCSNEEKYLKYMLLTPGISREYLKTLTGASELGLDANIVIKLLEQPEESFNMDTISDYVSKVRKGTEYNLKKEIANELIKGEWYIVSDINGSPQKFQLAPIEWLTAIKSKLDNIIAVLHELKNNSSHDDGVFDDEYGSITQTETDNDFPVPIGQEDFDEVLEESFDDSMLGEF